MKTEIKIKELSKLCGVSERTVKNWKKDGCPTIRNGGRYTYEVRHVFEWLIASGVPEKIQAAAKLESKLEGKAPAVETPSPSPAPVSRPETKEDIDLYMVKDLLYVLLKASKNRMGMYAQNSDHLRISIESNTFNKLADQFRKLDEACRQLDIDLGKVIKVEDVKKINGRILTNLKNHLRQLPYSMADRLSGMTDAKQIAEFMLAGIDEGLNVCAEKISKADYGAL